MSIVKSNSLGDPISENDMIGIDTENGDEANNLESHMKGAQDLIVKENQAGKLVTQSSTENAQGSRSLIEGPPDIEFAHSATDDGVMIGVEIFEESDLDTDTDNNKLQLYSDVDAAIESSDPVIDNGMVSVPGVIISPGKVKRKCKKYREPTRLSLEDRIKCIRMCSRYSSYADAQKAWRQTYNEDPPCTKTFSTLNKKFQRTGSVADLTRSGRPKTTRTEAVIARVEEAVSMDPSKSIRALAKDLGINQASVHRIKKEFEDKRNTLKMENRKLRDRLNDALKRIVILEKRLTHNLTSSVAECSSAPILSSAMEQKYETLVITAPDGSETAASFTSDHLDGHSGTNLPTIIALNNSNNQVLRLPPGQETIHIITIPQGSSLSSHHQVLSLDDSSSFQLSIPNTGPDDGKGTTSFLTSIPSSSSNHDTYVSFK